MDHMAGTGHRARAAAEAFFVVDNRVEVLHMYGVGRAFLHAQAAGDAADIAHRAGAGLGGRIKALIPIGTQHRDAVIQPPQGNESAGALAGACAAADTLLLVHLGTA